MDNLITEQSTAETVLEKILTEKIAIFKLKATGACNHAFYAETEKGNKYILKIERSDPELIPNNTLILEATIIKQLAKLNLSIPTPEILHVQEISPQLIIYKYIDGDLMIDDWNDLSEFQKVEICSKIGEFHAEIGKKFTKEMAESSGIKINFSVNIHPDSEAENLEIINSDDLPGEFIDLIKPVQQIFSQTSDQVFFQFIHNDAHHENILIKDSQLAGIIDWGEAEYGEIAKEFSRYIRDFPDHFEYIIKSYEQASGNHLSRKRLIAYAFLAGLSDNIADYKHGGKSKEQAIQAIETYRVILNKYGIIIGF